MIILNLGCGTKTSDKADVINIDWSIYLRVKQIKALVPIVPLLFRGERSIKFNSIPDNIFLHNLNKGIPFDANSVDVVYHSHLLEHFDRERAEKFLVEIKRILKPAGIHRIVVPDFEAICRAYIAHIESCEKNMPQAVNHDNYISEILEMSVRKNAYGTSKQKPVRRFVENLILGDARRRGETHQWAYDRFSLRAKLSRLGYKEVVIQKYNRSSVPNWDSYGLDVDENGNPHQPGSLFVEASK